MVLCHCNELYKNRQLNLYFNNHSTVYNTSQLDISISTFGVVKLSSSIWSAMATTASLTSDQNSAA